MSSPVEAILAEIGKAFRLCRFYPASHPSVQQALASVSSVLPDLVKVGAVELKITTTGFMLGSTVVAPRNPPVQELSSLLYTQGHRFLHLEPGLTVEEIGALIRAATSGAERMMQVVGGQPAFAQLPHIRLERAARKGTPKTPARTSAGSEGPVMGRRSMNVFRPDALPPDIEARRLAARLDEGAAQEEGERAAARLGELLPDLAVQHDFATLAAVVRTLGRASERGDALTSQAAALGLERLATAAIAGLVSRLGEPRLAAAEKDEAAQAVAALGPRAVGFVADAFLSAGDATEREILLSVVRRAGPLAAETLLSRANPDSRGETARAQAQLLGATRSPDAALILGAFAVHADPSVREAAIQALAPIGSPDASRITVGALRDPDARVRVAAARGIAWFGEATIAPILVARLEQEDEEEVAVALIAAVGELREAGAVAVLAAIARGISGVFQRHKVTVRVAAVRALASIGTEPARAVIKEVLASRTEEVRQAAAQALGA